MKHIQKAALKYVGNTYSTNQSGDVKVVGYEGYKRVEVEFEDGTKTYCRSGDLLNGEIWNPMQPSKYGRGFFGQGPHKYYEKEGSKKTSKEYAYWTGIFYRCFNERALELKPSYKDVDVCKEWDNFQEFAEWCQWQKGFRNENWQLDKDLINGKAKVYSPENCCFVPREINMSLILQERKRGLLPIGVTSTGRKFRAQWCDGEGQKYSPVLSDPIECFEIYKYNKEKYMISLADKWAGLIDERAEHSLRTYKVHLDD